MLNNIEFSVPQSQFPILISAGETIDLKICYSPINLGDARDTLAIEDFCSTLFIPVHGFCPVNISVGSSKCDVKTQVTTMKLPEKSFLSASPPVPNPSTGIIELNYLCYNDDEVFCEVYNLLGKRIHTDEIGIKQTETKNYNCIEGTYLINGNSLPNGVYLIKLYSKCDVLTFRVSLYK